MLEQIICAGFGGQGVLLMGQLLAQAALDEKRQVVWLPSYGPEMRGGTANCSVTIADLEIDSPIIDHPTALIAMNRPSLDRFEPEMAVGGVLLVNSSIVDRAVCRDDLRRVYVPCNDIARKLGDPRVANIVMLGAYLRATGCVADESLLAALQRKLGQKKRHLLAVNREALAAGAACV